MTDTKTQTLAEFLLARFAEDEACADHARSHNGGATFAKDNYGCLLVQPDRVLAECEAKRRLMLEHAVMVSGGPEQMPEHPEWSGDCPLCSRDYTDGGLYDYSEPHPCPSLRILAMPYADHPDFRQEWSV